MNTNVDLHYNIEMSEQGFKVTEKTSGRHICTCPDLTTILHVMNALEAEYRLRELKQLGY